MVSFKLILVTVVCMSIMIEANWQDENDRCEELRKATFWVKICGSIVSILGSALAIVTDGVSLLIEKGLLIIAGHVIKGIEKTMNGDKHACDDLMSPEQYKKLVEANTQVQDLVKRHNQWVCDQGDKLQKEIEKRFKRSREHLNQLKKTLQGNLTDKDYATIRMNAQKLNLSVAALARIKLKRRNYTLIILENQESTTNRFEAMMGDIGKEFVPAGTPKWAMPDVDHAESKEDYKKDRGQQLKDVVLHYMTKGFALQVKNIEKLAEALHTLSNHVTRQMENIINATSEVQIDVERVGEAVEKLSEGVDRLANHTQEGFNELSTQIAKEAFGLQMHIQQGFTMISTQLKTSTLAILEEMGSSFKRLRNHISVGFENLINASLLTHEDEMAQLVDIHKQIKQDNSRANAKLNTILTLLEQKGFRERSRRMRTMMETFINHLIAGSENDTEWFESTLNDIKKFCKSTSGYSNPERIVDWIKEKIFYRIKGPETRDISEEQYVNWQPGAMQLLSNVAILSSVCMKMKYTNETKYQEELGKLLDTIYTDNILAKSKTVFQLHYGQFWLKFMTGIIEHLQK